VGNLRKPNFDLSIERGAQQRMISKIMSAKMVSMKLKDLTPLTQADQERLAALAARPDSEIDLSDVPELNDEDWKNAVRSKHYRPFKTQITSSLDKDVLAWLKADGRGVTLLSCISD
jgi:uncharacterized protein (DUF4415 family)